MGDPRVPLFSAALALHLVRFTVEARLRSRTPAVRDGTGAGGVRRKNGVRNHLAGVRGRSNLFRLKLIGQIGKN